ncbi:HAD family phosphatase [Candidatus Woesebacteria bacterium]|nr:MAG: HAD family phosphatase [Candidatus Woesebacteria bacterium]
MKKYGAIFDLDGTIVDDDFIYGNAFSQVLKKLGAKNVPDIPHTGGIGIDENWPILFDKYKITTQHSIEDLSALVTDYFLAHVKLARIKRGFISFAHDLGESDFAIALATSTTWSIADALISTLDLQGVFESITTGEEVGNKKPSPEIFNLAADKISVPAKQCVVFEDSAAGVEAGLSAGMMVVGVYKDEIRKEALSGAHKLIHDFDLISVEEVLALFSDK